MTLKVEWIDRGREPQCPPNPAHPKGIDIDATYGAFASCETALPYPAKRCGLYVVDCPDCGQRIVITTAGRTDDPRSIKLGCKRPEKAQ
jgi:DNA-directed RNA polymerase subunit RPC12/RpoP